MSYFENIYVSASITFFKDIILKTYPNLKYGYDANKPMIFFGMYRNEELNLVLNHRHKCLIIWGGSDALKFKAKSKSLVYPFFRNSSKIFHIAQSKWISDDLKSLNFKHKLLPWYSLTKSKFTCKEKGNCIYIYLPTRFYGADLFEKLKKKLNGKYEFIIGGGNLRKEQRIPYDKMPEIYSKCFIGLRLVPHDGLGSTVQELGLMGIKCVHNGNSPSALNYKNIDDIIKHIENEAKTIGLKDEELSKKVDKYLNIDSSFFKVATWFKPTVKPVKPSLNTIKSGITVSNNGSVSMITPPVKSGITVSSASRAIVSSSSSLLPGLPSSNLKHDLDFNF